MILLKEITKIYNEYKVLDQITWELEDREFVALLGPSGSGKTTLLRLIAGLERPDSGCLWIENELVSSKTKYVAPHKRKLGMVFQDLALWPHLTVSENIGFGLQVQKISSAEREKRIKEVLRMVKLHKHWNYYPQQLSGGEKQRIALARALVLRPSILLLDEPLSSLDLLLKEELQDLILHIHQQMGISMIYVTHDQVEIKRLGVKVVLIANGRIRQTGTYQELVAKPKDDFVKMFIRG